MAIMLSLTAFTITPTVKSEQLPPLPMTVEGYVFIQKTSGQNITAPQGLYVYAKNDSNIISSTTTESNGHYGIPVSGPDEGTPIDMWVQTINVTRIILHYWNITELNMTVIDTTPPSIQIISPLQNVTVGQPTWINATLTDNLAIDATTIKMTLNGTALSPTYDPATGLLSCQTSSLTGGLYVANISAADIAGNTATKTWNFTAVSPAPPTITIISPTTASPIYTQSGKAIQVTVNYTELNPLNGTIKVYNETNTILETFNQTAITPGTNITLTINITMPTASDGKYSINVTLYNTYNLSTTATQTNAIVIDNTPPIIETLYQTPPGETVQPNVTVNVDQGLNVTVRVNVTDATSGVKQVILSYNVTATEWANITMQKTTGNEYTATIPSSQLSIGTTITYYITALDNATNTAKTPTNGIYFQYHVIPEFSNFTVLLLILAIGTTLALAASKTTKRKSPPLK
jgi:hypothetical protein